jgi:hypothetical protein
MTEGVYESIMEFLGPYKAYFLPVGIEACTTPATPIQSIIFSIEFSRIAISEVGRDRNGRCSAVRRLFLTSASSYFFANPRGRSNSRSRSSC